ncbi:MAG: hypothetical protein OEV43_06855, partial [Coriobacteriia bacterium]|nr:hypothetical protein [Coriobacteriia bacterium]
MSEDFVASLGSAAAAFGVATAIGILLDLLLYGILQSKAARKQWKAGAEVARSLRGLPTALGILAGVWAAARRLPFDEFQL